MSKHMVLARNEESVSVYLRAAVLSLMSVVLLHAGCTDFTVRLFMESKESTSLESTLILVGAFAAWTALLKYVPRDERRFARFLCAVVSAVFTIFTVCGLCYNVDDPSRSFLSLFAENASNKLALCVLLLSAFCLYQTFLCRLRSLLFSLDELWGSSSVAEKVEAFLLGRFGWLRQALLLVLCWGPQLAIRYPGYVTQDAFHSLAQYYGMTPYTTKHPLIFALTFGKIVDVGAAAGRPNHGLFLFMIIQTALVAFMVLHVTRTLLLLEAPSWLACLTFLGFLLSPIVSSSALVVLKDVPFLAGYVILMDEVALFLFGKERQKFLPVHLAMCAASVFLLFYRNNGVHVALLLSAVLALREIYVALRERSFEGARLLFVAVIIASTFGGRALNSYLIDKYDAEQVTTRVVYASTMQQIGRYAYLYEIPEEDWATLQRVIDAPQEKYAESYYPLKFDAIKRFFRQDATKEDLKTYLTTWLKLGRQHPGVYLASIIHQNYLMFSPLENNVRFYAPISSYWMWDGNEYSFDLSTFFEEKEELIPYQARLLQLYKSASGMPFIGFTTNVGLAALLFFGMIVYSILRRDGTWLILALPALLTMAITFFGPAYSGNARYLYPLLWTIPLLTATFIRGEKAPGAETDEQL